MVSNNYVHVYSNKITSLLNKKIQVSLFFISYLSTNWWHTNKNTQHLRAILFFLSFRLYLPSSFYPFTHMPAQQFSSNKRVLSMFVCFAFVEPLLFFSNCLLISNEKWWHIFYYLHAQFQINTIVQPFEIDIYMEHLF